MKKLKILLFILAIMIIPFTVEAKKTTEATTEKSTEKSSEKKSDKDDKSSEESKDGKDDKKKEKEFAGWDDSSVRMDCYAYLGCTDWDQIVDPEKKYIQGVKEDGTIVTKDRTMRNVFEPTTVVIDDSTFYGDGKTSSLREQIVAYARTKVGNHYVLGGTNPDCKDWGGPGCTGGVDCSGFLMVIYGHFGIDIPYHYTESQYTMCKDNYNGYYLVDKSEAMVGDILFFRDSAGFIHHVAIYAGGNKRIHASCSAAGIVETDDLKDNTELFAVGRVIVQDYSDSELKYMSAFLQYSNEKVQGGTMTAAGMRQLGYVLLDRWNDQGTANELPDEDLLFDCSEILKANLRFFDDTANDFSIVGGTNVLADWNKLLKNGAKKKYVDIAKDVLTEKHERKMKDAKIWVSYEKAQWYKTTFGFDPNDNKTIKRKTNSKIKARNDGYFYERSPWEWIADKDKPHITAGQSILDAMREFKIEHDE